MPNWIGTIGAATFSFRRTTFLFLLVFSSSHNFIDLQNKNKSNIYKPKPSKMVSTDDTKAQFAASRSNTAGTSTGVELMDSTEMKAIADDNKAEADEEIILKIPALTPIYWCEKMTATTFGETFADWFTQTLGFGYTYTSIVIFAFFFVTLGVQLKVTTYWPVIFWLVMASSSVAGTCFSDFIDRTLQLGYPVGMSILLSILLFIMGCWKMTGEHMSVEGAMTRKAEAFYWATILVSNTLGTAWGDFLADSLELGFAMTAGIIGGLLLVCAGLAYFTKLSHVVLFWIAFVLTRPFGATFGDLLTKGTEKGGLDLGTLPASMVIFALFVVYFAIEMYMRYKARQVKEAKKVDSESEESDVESSAPQPHHHIETEGDFMPWVFCKSFYMSIEEGQICPALPNNSVVK